MSLQASDRKGHLYGLRRRIVQDDVVSCRCDDTVQRDTDHLITEIVRIVIGSVIINEISSHKLLSMLRRQAGEDENWKVFKSYFSQVHNDFDQQLKAASEDLTENDILLASFLRMNLTTKEIASLLNVLPDSVLKPKYRLKKKLGLGKEQQLGAYLEGFG